MKIYQEENYDAMSRRAALITAAEIIHKPDCVLGLPTGSTPVGTYKELIAMYRRGEISFREVRSVNLDEYRGLAPDHDQSYRYFMQTNLFDHIDIDVKNTLIPNGLAVDAEAECAAYDRRAAEWGRVDLQLLGIGRNGHIGFNEPDSCFTKNTHVVNLTQSTIAANSRFFARMEDVPRQALTMGIGNIMNARRILFMASGADKADALCNAFCGPITPACPASILQLHPDVILVADQAALSKLTEKGVVICES